MDERRLLSRATHCHIEGTWNVGRQLNRWIDNIKDDTADLGINIRSNGLSKRSKKTETSSDKLIVKQRLTEEQRRRRRRIRYSLMLHASYWQTFAWRHGSHHDRFSIVHVLDGVQFLLHLVGLLRELSL